MYDHFKLISHEIISVTEIQNFYGRDVSLTHGFYKELATLFIRVAPTYKADVQEAIRKGDTAEVARVFHKLKSASGYLGALRLKETSTVLNQLAQGGSVDSWNEPFSTFETILEQTVNELRQLTSE